MQDNQPPTNTFPTANPFPPDIPQPPKPSPWKPIAIIAIAIAILSIAAVIYFLITNKSSDNTSSDTSSESETTPPSSDDTNSNIDPELLPFLEALEASGVLGNPFNGTLAGSLDNIKDSLYEPYQTIGIGVYPDENSGATGLFYRTSPSSNWVFFAMAQEMLSCEAYDTIDLQRAFLGEDCYSDYPNSDIAQVTITL